MKGLVIVLCVILPVLAVAEVCDSCQVTVSEQQAYDRLLVLSGPERARSIGTHLPFGIPEAPGATNNKPFAYTAVLYLYLPEIFA